MVIQSTSKKMDKKLINNVDPENINIIKRIIDDFEHQSKVEKKPRKRYKKFSLSDTTLAHKESRHCKKSQVSPKPPQSLRGSLIYRKDTVDSDLENNVAAKPNSNVYINFVEGVETENTDANSLYLSKNDGERARKPRKSIWSARNGPEGIIDELKQFMSDKKQQERVNKNVKEVGNA